jgi:hypothetical protein
VVDKPAGSTVTFGDAGVYNTTATVDVYGAYTYKWTITNGPCSSSDNVIVTFYELITAAAGSDQALCNTSTFTLAGNAASPGVGTWTIQSGPGSITSIHLENSTVTGVTAGSSTTLRWTIVNGTCSSYDEVTLTNNPLHSLTGIVSYYNTSNTLLTGSAYTIELYRTSDNVLMGSTHPDDITGRYTFTNLCPSCDYYIKGSSTHTTAGSVNTTDAAQVNYYGINPTLIEGVRWHAGDVGTSGNNPDGMITALDADRIQRHFVYGDDFDKPWRFWKTDDRIQSATSPSGWVPSVPQSSSDVIMNIYGLCTGDFNMSFNPSITKAASSTLELIYTGNRQVGSNQEFDLPVRVMNPSVVGAVSLILNFPNDLVDVQNVTMNGTGGQFDWTVNGNELRIGWNSQNPLDLAAATSLLTLHLKTTAAFTTGNSIRFALAANPLNELANGEYNVIGDAVLGVDVINAATTGINNLAAGQLTLGNYPNPFNGSTTITYTLPVAGKVTLEIRNLLGVVVKVLVNEVQAAGDHALKYDASTLVSGIYTATIRLSSSSDELVKTIKIVSKK